MKMVRSLFWVFVVFTCVFSINSAFAADTYTISGTVSEIGTFPNMIAIDEGDVITEIYGIRFNYLERRYDIVIEVGTEVTVEAYEKVCYDGTTRLKATSITVGDATIDFGSAAGQGAGSGSGSGSGPGSGSGSGSDSDSGSGAGQGRNRRN